MKEYDVLYTLSKCPEPIRQTDLNRHVLLSQPALSRMVDRLADQGLVERVVDPGDRRGLRLSLTEEGRAVQRRIGRRHGRSVAREMLKELTPDELRQLEELCRKLVQGSTPRAKGLRAPGGERESTATARSISKDFDIKDG
jgi:DNA-binding MarR family transcriptional regulator